MHDPLIRCEMNPENEKPKAFKSIRYCEVKGENELSLFIDLCSCLLFSYVVLNLLSPPEDVGFILFLFLTTIASPFIFVQQFLRGRKSKLSTIETTTVFTSTMFLLGPILGFTVFYFLRMFLFVLTLWSLRKYLFNPKKEVENSNFNKIYCGASSVAHLLFLPLTLLMPPI